VVDDELFAAFEEIGEGGGLFIAGGSQSGEGVGFGDLNDGECAALFAEGVVRFGELFFFGEKVEPRCAVFVGGDDLVLGLAWCGEKLGGPTLTVAILGIISDSGG
jgi:hypothetical protein